MHGLQKMTAEALRAAAASRPADGRLIVFADDWGRHPSSAQHLVRHLLGSREIAWINTIGTRAPELNLATLHRGLEKLRQWRSPPAAAPASGPAPKIYSPRMYPGFRSGWQRRLNASLLARFLGNTFGSLEDAVVLTNLPIVADLPERVNARKWVYYCVDDFSAWPGLDAEPLRAMENKLVARADEIVAVGENLAQRMRSLGRESHLIGHGIDPEHWSRTTGSAALLDGLPGPIVLFWGLIDARLDIGALRALSDRMTEGTIALVGPEQAPDPALDSIARVRRLGPAPYSSLPALAARAAVLVMPYADLPVTRAMQPLKLKEYLATGKPVVCTRLPAIAGWEDCLDVVDSPERFASATLERCTASLPAAQLAARARLQAESWKAKSEQLAHVLFGS